MPTTIYKLFIRTFLALIFVATHCFAAEPPATESEIDTETEDSTQVPTRPTHELFENLDYPELQVVPRASRRLYLEKEEENSNWWWVHWPIQFSSLTTLFVSFRTDNFLRSDLSAEQLDDYKTAKTGARLIGVGWIVGAMLVGLDKPYNDGFQKVRDVKGKGKRSQLLRERLAEETLEQSAELMKTLRLASTITNAGISLYLASFVEEGGTIYTLASALLAFLPYWIEDRHIYNYKKHMNYKKNIYAPVSSFMYVPEQTEEGMKFYPSLNLAWNF